MGAQDVAAVRQRIGSELAHELAQFIPDGGTARVLYGIRTWTTTRLP
ncbi:hypothetical protein [Streptomyces xinghaiensis]|nr:hypothetical protein [Streptomyces xinghaiensis]MZE79721.1 hypothetical protein [Streptomyces sp. SID5475]